jgi:hypothetical protein
MHGYMHNRGGLPAALAGASVDEIQNHQNRIPRQERTAQKNSRTYNLNRAAPCPVTITGICGHVAGITGHDHRNTHYLTTYRDPLMESMNLEQLLRSHSDLEAIVIARDHANCDSLPLRYGIHFECDTILPLRRTRFLYADYQFSDRLHIEAEFDSADGSPTTGHFVIGTNRRYGHPVVITVWRHDLDTETRLSEVMKLLRTRGFLTPKDLLVLHPLYVSGEITSHADLIQQLALKMSASRVAEMEVEAKSAAQLADKAIAELESAKREAEIARQVALEASYLVDELQEKNMTLSSENVELKAELEAERQRYKLEQTEANKERSQATLSSPDKLVEVREQQIYRGSSCTILIMDDGKQHHMKTSTFDPYSEVTKKAKSLLGRRVRISCWDPIGQPGKWSSQGYFRNIYAAE